MRRFLDGKETIRFGAKTAQTFGLVDVASKAKNAYYDAEVEKIEEDEKQVKLYLKITDHQKKEFKKEIIVSKVTLSKKEATIVGWCYITLIDEDKKYREKAKEYLDLAIKDDTGSFFDFSDKKKPRSALPYWLLSKHNLFESSDIAVHRLYDAIGCEDVSSDFFSELFRHENDKIRKIDIAKKALKLFPKDGDEYFIDFVVNDFLKKGKLKEARAFFETAVSKIPKQNWTHGYPHLKVTVIKLLTAQKDFPSAEKILGTTIFNKSTDSLLKGRFYFEKGDYEKATQYFRDAIALTIRDTDDTQASYYYLLACYAKTKNIPEIKDIIESAKLCHQELRVEYPLDFDYADLAEKTLKSILKLKVDEMLKTRIKGLLAYIQASTLPTPYDDKPVRALTVSEKKTLKEAEGTLKEALDYYPDDKMFNATYSNLLYLKKDYDNSLRYKLRAIEGVSSSQIFFSLQVKMSDATDGFLDTYTSVLEDAVDNYGVSVEDYIEYQFAEDVEALYEKKKFQSVKSLYEYVKPNINNLASIGENFVYGKSETGLFELAYSLRECGDDKNAKIVYEAHLETRPNSSSALNNLAIIYEKEGDIEKAKELIKKAKENSTNDEVVERNYNRIFSDKGKKTETSQSKPQIQKPKIVAVKTPQTIVENGTGYFLLDGGKIEVGPAKNIPFKLLEALCPLGQAKAINAIFNTSSSDRSKFKTESLSTAQKQDILRTRIKELQETLRKKKVRVSLVFNERDEVVSLKLAKK
ncbi:hypothetical protein K8Q94_00525 [Candidatus Nomurabacteria bacterium]|nr:hypothetical protein [Candidatus Nomurabacteria bacterium]